MNLYEQNETRVYYNNCKAIRDLISISERNNNLKPEEIIYILEWEISARNAYTKRQLF